MLHVRNRLEVLPRHARGSDASRAWLSGDLGRGPGKSLIPGAAPAFANAVGIDGCSASSRESSDGCPFLAPDNSANYGSRTGTRSGGEFVAMLLPETSTVSVAVPDTAIVGVRVIAMPMPKIATGPGRSWRNNQQKQHHCQQHAK
jgi:hypothetical protein